MQTPSFRFDLREASGALGDLGTLLPLTLGAIAVADLAPTPVLAGFGIGYCATAVTYRLPVPVQPMKAIVAVLLVAEVTPAALAASGVMIGAVLLVLGTTGWIERLGRLLPQSVLAGLQLGLGLALAVVAVGLIRDGPVVGLAAAALLVGLLFTRLPAALIVVAAAILLGLLTGPGAAPVAEARPILPPVPSWSELRLAVTDLALPQLSLTLTNAIVLTALVAGDSFGARARQVTPRRLSLSTGLMNLGLAPLGALPMCHGAGGLAAHHRFGARTGGAPLMLGTVLLGLALLPEAASMRILGAIPAPVLGAMLLVAAGQLAWSRRLIDAKPSCRPVIAVTALLTLFSGPFAALLAGTLSELVRLAIVRHLQRRSA